MIKRLLLPIIVLSFFLTNCDKSKFNDLDEFGMQGPVKEVKTSYFININFKGRSVDRKDEHKINDKSVTFDENGNIQTWSSTYYPPDGSESKSSKVKFIVENGKKTRYENCDIITDSIIESASFDWVNNLEYTSTINSNKQKVINECILSPNNGRDLSGCTKIWIDGELIIHDTYENILEGNRIVSTTIKDWVNLSSNKMVLEYFEFDDFDNPTEFLIYNETADSIDKYVVRSYTYY